jgi:hypothetical protein
MKQLSILLLLITFRLVTFGQVYQEMPQYGYRANRMAFDSTLQIPTFCGVPTLKSVVKANKNGAIAFDSCNNKLYQYNPKTLTWTEISGGGGIDSLKRSADSIYARKNGNFIFQYKDSVSGGGGIGGSGSQYYVPKFSASTTLQNSQIFDSVNVGINTTTPAYKLDVNGTARIKNDLYADEDFVVNNYFAINTTATDFPIPDGTLGIWRRKGNGFGTKFLEDEQGGAKDKWAFVKRQGYDQTRDWFQINSSILNINYGWGNPNQSNLDGSTLLINPTIRIGNSLNTNTKIRGIYYNPTLDSLVNTTHIAFESTSGNVVMKGLKTSSSTTDSIAIWINDTLSKAPYPSGGVGGAVDTIFRTLGKDSIFYKKNNITYAIKDSVDGGAFLPLSGGTLTGNLNGTTATFSSNGSSNTFNINHTSGSGHGLEITKAGNGEGIIVNKTSGSGNAVTITGTLNATTLVKNGGTSSQFLKADGSVDATIYVSDTTALQRKSIPAYSILANNTSVTANATAKQFRDTSGVYSGTITFTGTTAPSGATNHSYRLTQVGKCVTLHIALVFATNGAALTAVQMTLPTGAPTPVQPAGLTGSIFNMYPVTSQLVNSVNQLILSSSARGYLRNNTAANGFEIFITFVSAAPGQVGVTVQYWTN